MKTTQGLLEKSAFVKSDQFKQYEQGSNIELMYLSPLNSEYKQKETLNVAYNLYITKMTEINGYTR